jgi:hypothetical protein
MYTVKFDASKYKNLRVGKTTITGFTMREVDGADEEVAANSAKAKGGSVTPAEELVRASIVDVNGEPTRQPYLAFDTWNSRARAFALKAFKTLNGAEEEELDSFAAAAEPVGDVSPRTSGAAASATD